MSTHTCTSGDGLPCHGCAAAATEPSTVLDLMARLKASVIEAKRAREARQVGTGNPTQPRADD